MTRFLQLYCAIAALCIMLMACQGSKKDNHQWTATSPNGSLKITMIADSTRLSYFVMIGEDTVVRKSSLGVSFSNEDFQSGLQFVSATDSVINDEYTLVTGKRRQNQARANQTIVTFKNANNRTIQLALRAYDDGVAFRYQFPDVQDSVTVVGEATSFAIPTNGK